MFAAPPTVRSKEQVAVASFVLADTLFGEMTFTALLDLVHRSSTQVPLFMPRHLQTWYSREDCFVCRHPDGCVMSVAGVLLFEAVYHSHL